MDTFVEFVAALQTQSQTIPTRRCTSGNHKTFFGNPCSRGGRPPASSGFAKPSKNTQTKSKSTSLSKSPSVPSTEVAPAEGNLRQSQVSDPILPQTMKFRRKRKKSSRSPLSPALVGFLMLGFAANLLSPGTAIQQTAPSVEAMAVDPDTWLKYLYDEACILSKFCTMTCISNEASRRRCHAIWDTCAPALKT